MNNRHYYPLGIPSAPFATPQSISARRDSELGYPRVVVDFVNAPAGMRSGLRQARGPSDLTVRTQTAFAAP